MGANSYVVTLEGDKKKVEKAWDRIVENDRYESGEGAYAGNATTMDGSITFYDRRLASYNEAYEFCLDKHDKWCGPVAVSYYLPAEQGKRDKAREEKAKAKAQAAFDKAYAVVAKANDGVRNRKSKLIGCRHCGSKLSKEHYIAKPRVEQLFNNPVGYKTCSTFACPICFKVLLSETMVKRIEGHKAKIEEARLALREAQKPKPSKKIAWAVGGWAAS
jgi:hypothetical protein